MTFMHPPPPRVLTNMFPNVSKTWIHLVKGRDNRFVNTVEYPGVIIV